MEIRPILSSLMRHKTASLLIVLEITLSCAIICNAIFVIGSRVSHMQASSGTAEEEIIMIINGKPTRVLKPVSVSARLKAAELIGKRLGMWTDRKCIYPAEPVIIVDNLPRPEQKNGIENTKNEIKI